jgi:hypothetical protein
MKRTGGLFIAALLLFPGALGAQAAGSDTLEGLTSQAREAISQSAYESAVKILTEAKTRYPESPKANLALGDLYYDKELYSLALTEYRDAETKGATDFATLTQISRCYGKLNQEKSSIEYLTRILRQYPDSADTVDDLGWMYFKTHQLDKGEEVVLDGMKRLGQQRGMAMTLGTIYSGMNRYDESRTYYLKSVDEALRVGDRDFASIAYYNLSLLEHNFFHFNSALRYTDESLSMEDRPSGHLARGELFQARMDFDSAQVEFQTAYATDATPLSKVNLAILLQKFGKLELARRYAEEVMSSKDLAWLLYFGTDLTRHFKDMHELLSLIYRGLSIQESHRPSSGIIDRIGALIASARYALIGWYHDQRFRQYSLEAGKQYLAQGSAEDAWWEFYRGNQAYPEVALKYLGLARELETARTPHAASYYSMEEGKVRHSAQLLEQALGGFDPFWEKEPAADTLLALIPLLSRPEQQERRRTAIADLYQMNPGALPQAGIGLPFAISWSGSGWTAREKRTDLRFLRRAGSECREAPAVGYRFSLRLVKEQDGVRWTVTDGASTAILREGKAASGGTVTQRSARLIQSILEELYSVH